MKVSKRIVEKIIEDMSDRRDMWDGIDKSTQKEIRRTWAKIIEEELNGVINESESQCPFGKEAAKQCTPSRHNDCRQCDGRNA